MLRHDAFGLRDIFRRVPIEERIDGFRRPFRNCNAVADGPDFNLVQVLFDERLAEVLA